MNESPTGQPTTVSIPMTQDGERREATVTFWPDYQTRRCHVRLCVAGLEREAAAFSYYHAFMEIRKELEPLGMRFLCYAASRNAHPSGMCIDMGAGLKTYRNLTFGNKPSLEQLVDVFDTGPDVIPATVEEQEEYYQSWLKSIGFPPQPYSPSRQQGLQAFLDGRNGGRLSKAVDRIVGSLSRFLRRLFRK